MISSGLYRGHYRKLFGRVTHFVKAEKRVWPDPEFDHLRADYVLSIRLYHYSSACPCFFEDRAVERPERKITVVEHSLVTADEPVKQDGLAFFLPG